MTKKILLILFGIIFIINSTNYVFSTDENANEKIEKIEKYNNTAKIIWTILILLLIICIMATIILIWTHFGLKHLANYFLIIGFICLVFALYIYLKLN